MLSAWILTLAVGGVAADAVDDAEISPAPTVEKVRQTANDAAPPRSGRELREAYADLVRRSSKRAEPDPDEIVPELVALYIEVAESQALSRPEAGRIQRGLQSRLEEFRSQLDRQERRRLRDSRSADDRNQAERLLGGGGDVAQAQRLIELIENTIAPDTWEINGGRGRIMYYEPLKVLVVRQTGEVHHQLGNTLDALRR